MRSSAYCLILLLGTSLSDTSAGAMPEAGPTDPCALVEAHNARVIADAVAFAKKATTDPSILKQLRFLETVRPATATPPGGSPWTSDVRGAHPYCTADRAGAWALAYRDLEIVPTSKGWVVRNAHVEVVRVELGRFVTVGLPQGFSSPTAHAPPFARIPLETANCCSDCGEAPAFEIVDVDKDGVSEIAYNLTPARRQLVASRGGKIVVLAEGLDRLEDIDEDGLLDIVYSAKYSIPADCRRYHRKNGPALLAHNVGGGRFSLDDDVARAHAAKFCPGVPRTYLDVEDVACARMRGVPAAEIRSFIEEHLETTCGPRAPKRKLVMNGVEDYYAMLAAADAPVPFELR